MDQFDFVPDAPASDGFHAVPVSVVKASLARFDTNKDSAAASAIERAVNRSYRHPPDGRIVG